MKSFDYTTISDAAIRDEYKHILQRANRISTSLGQAYGGNRKPIKTIYIKEQSFNSFASLKDDHYLVELDSSIPLFLLILFARLLSDETVLSFLGASGKLESDYSLPFIVDPINFDARKNWKIELDAMRSFAAGTLADICSTFVVCHEAGHIVSGHIEGLQHYESKDSLAELTSFAKTRSKDIERRQAWEYEADGVAATLLLNFIEELAQDTQSNERTARLFGADSNVIEHILSITIVALYAFFSYIRGVRYKLRLGSTHPHPIVRAYCVRNFLVTAASSRWSIDQKILLQLMDERLDEFMSVMEKMALFDSRHFDEDYIANTEKQAARLTMVRDKYRDSCKQWSWISWE